VRRLTRVVAYGLAAALSALGGATLLAAWLFREHLGERAVGRLIRFEAALGAILLVAVVAGAWLLCRREARDRQEWERRLWEFQATAGHELRNQLTVISGYTQVARAGREEETQRRVCGTPPGRGVAEIQRMASLIDELCLLSRLDLGQPLRKQRIDLAELCRDAHAVARDCHPEHPVRLFIAPGEHTVRGDPGQLHQVVANLLVNARVHTPPGTTTKLGLGTEDGYRVIEIVDDGPGVPPELRERIFERFVRGEDATAVGSGLGLGIVAAIAAAHGGTVSLEPHGPGAQGAWFRVRLPVEGPPPRKGS
jgi:signal transduction histidine kinase